MIGWKQGYTLGYENIVLIKLEIPDDAKVVHVKQYGTTKDFYYCDKASVKRITSFDGKHRVRWARSMKDGDFKYHVGEEVHARFDCGIGKQAGIYFFKTRKQAKEYEY